MKVILLEDIKGVGAKGQVYEASDGYARNYLFPRKKAIEATKASLNELELKKKAMEGKAERDLAQAQAKAEEFKDITLKIYVKTGENGRLFGSVTVNEIASELLNQYNIQIDKKRISLSEPIKTVGETTAAVKLHPSVTASIKIFVTNKD